jgi:hypothetical protein
MGPDPKGGVAMMSPHTHVALARVRDEDAAREAARRPDAVPDPEERVAETATPGRVKRRLARLHLAPSRYA